MENFKIIDEKENPLFNRKKIKITIESNASPKHTDVETFISKKFSAPIENIKIKKILGKFGSNLFTITANIYGSKENKENIERKKKEKKK